MLEASVRPLLPTEILEAAQQAVPALGLATVYRNLKRLADDGYAVAQLETMHALYAAAWADLGVTRLDGTRPLDELATQIARDVYPALP